MTDLKNEKPEDWLGIIFDKMLYLEEKSRSLRKQESELLRQRLEHELNSTEKSVKHHADVDTLGLEYGWMNDERNRLSFLLQYAGLEAHLKDIQNTLEYRKELNAHNERVIESNLAIAKATETVAKAINELKEVIKERG